MKRKNVEIVEIAEVKLELTASYVYEDVDFGERTELKLDNFFIDSPFEEKKNLLLLSLVIPCLSSIHVRTISQNQIKLTVNYVYEVIGGKIKMNIESLELQSPFNKAMTISLLREILSL